MSSESYGEKRMNKALVLSYTRDDVIHSLRYVNELRRVGTAVVILGLDFGSWAELRRRNISYKKPADYLDTAKCAKIDAEAVALARSWYEPIRDKITYRGICLGEIVEYDFLHLFVDALRAIEIADCIIAVEKPDRIFLPRNLPIVQANAVRYEALRNVMIDRARSKEIPVLYTDPTAEAPLANIGNIVAVLATSSIELARRTLGSIVALYLTIASQTRPCGKRELQSTRNIVFVGVPDEVFLPIKNELEQNRGAVAIRMDAHLMAWQQRASPETETMIDGCKGAEEKGHFGQDLVYANVQLAEILAPRFSQFFVEECRRLVRCIEGMEAFIRHAKPSILVTMEDASPIYRLITRVCKMRRIPTLVIQHGMTAVDPGVHPVLPVEADVQAVWGNLSKDWAIKRGKSPQSQVITGNPRYDFITHRRRPDQARIALSHRLGLKTRGAVVVIATSWYQPTTSSYTPERDEAFLRNSLAAMKSFPEVQVVVKLHPAQSKEYETMARAIMDELQISAVITERFLWELLETCDLLIADTSTVVLEAILFDKPVVTFNPDRGLKPTAFAETLKVCSKVELVGAIKDMLYDTYARTKLAVARRQSIHQYAYCQDGKASRRVAELIEEMICPRSTLS
jgi:hypothetical protein